MAYGSHNFKLWGEGIPLGNLTSQIFANIYLDELDKFLKHDLHIHHYIRYADDFVMLDRDKKYLEKLVPIINNFLITKLKIKLHPQKIIITKFNQGVDFLGYVCFPHHRLIRTKTKRRMFKKLKERMEKTAEGAITPETFNQSLQSYLGMLQHANTYKLRGKLKYDP